MKNILFISILLTSCMSRTFSQGENEDPTFAKTKDLVIRSVSVKYNADLELLVFSMTVEGSAGATVPNEVGQLDGAPVLGYVFPTNLKSADVGFGETEGIVALALTSHPDFDDTPLWDENYDRNFGNDGVVWHSHWVVLESNESVAGGLSVKQFDPENDKVTLPPTNPGMPMYMDSPGFQVLTNGNQIKVLVPSFRVSGKATFNFDAVAVYMQVNTSKEELPLLGVYAVYSVASGDLSLPYSVK
ncbi:MAG: hypothetical protein ABJP45_13400 [Cyclobacteriaceae bacterium]